MRLSIKNSIRLAERTRSFLRCRSSFRRFRRAKAARGVLGEADYPIDEEFLDCLPQIESAAGVALGVDRLVMVLTGQSRISSVRAEI